MCVYVLSGGGKKKGTNERVRKGGLQKKEREREKKKKEQMTVMADGALWDKHRSCPGGIKEQIQMADAACCSTPDCSVNITGQQVPSKL